MYVWGHAPVQTNINLRELAFRLARIFLKLCVHACVHDHAMHMGSSLEPGTAKTHVLCLDGVPRLVRHVAYLRTIGCQQQHLALKLIQSVVWRFHYHPNLERSRYFLVCVESGSLSHRVEAFEVAFAVEIRRFYIAYAGRVG